MKVVQDWNETWQAEYTLGPMEYGSICAEVPQAVWDRLQAAQKELETARDAIAIYFAKCS